MERARLRRLLLAWGPSVVLAVAGTHELLYNHSAPREWLPAEALIGLLGVRRRAPEVVLLGTVVLALVGWLQDDLLVAHLGVLVALHAVASLRPRARAFAAAALVEAAALLVAGWFSPAGSLNDWLILLSGLTMTALLLGTTQRARRQYLDALEDRADQLERERHQKEAIAAAEERARIAREIHDIVAHSVSVMVALSEGAAATPDAEASRRVMRQVAATGRESLSELRRVLSVLHAPDEAGARRPQPSLGALDALARDIELAGVRVDLEVGLGAAELPEALQTTVFRIVQESLTNTLKHAEDARRCRVRVAVEGNRVQVEVRDDGRGRTPGIGVPGDGNGLRGMGERARLYGGTVTAGPDDEGWVVTGVLDRTTAPA